MPSLKDAKKSLHNVSRRPGCRGQQHISNCEIALKSVGSKKHGFHAQLLHSMCIMTLMKHMHQALNDQDDGFNEGQKQVRPSSHETKGISDNSSKVLEPKNDEESWNQREERLGFSAQTICFSLDHKYIFGESAAHYLDYNHMANDYNHYYKSVGFLCGEYSKVFNLSKEDEVAINKEYHDKFQDIVGKAFRSVRYKYTLLVLLDVDHTNSFPSDAYRTAFPHADPCNTLGGRCVNNNVLAGIIEHKKSCITEEESRRYEFYDQGPKNDIPFDFWNLNIPDGGKWRAVQVYRDKKDAKEKKEIKIKIDSLISNYLWDCFANSKIPCDQARLTLFNSILSFSNKQKYNEIYGCYTANKFDFLDASLETLLKLYGKHKIEDFKDLQNSFKNSLFFNLLKTDSELDIDRLKKLIEDETINDLDQGKLVKIIDCFLSAKNKNGISGISLASEPKRKVIFDEIMKINDDQVKKELIRKMILSRFSGCSKNFLFSSKNNNLDGYSNIPRGIYKAMAEPDLRNDNKNDIPRIIDSLKTYNKNKWLVLSVSSNYKLNAVFNVVFLLPLVMLKSIPNFISRKGSTATFYKNISKIHNESNESNESNDCLKYTSLAIT